VQIQNIVVERNIVVPCEKERGKGREREREREREERERERKEGKKGSFGEYTISVVVFSLCR